MFVHVCVCVCVCIYLCSAAVSMYACVVSCMCGCVCVCVCISQSVWSRSALSVVSPSVDITCGCGRIFYRLNSHQRFYGRLPPQSVQ